MNIEDLKKNGTSDKVFTAEMTFFASDVTSVIALKAKIYENVGYFPNRLTIGFKHGGVKTFEGDTVFFIIHKLFELGFYTEDEAAAVVDYLKGDQNEA